MGVEQRLPGLMYADDVALLADNYEDLQALVSTCEDEGKALGFTVSADKSGFMVFNDPTDQVLTIQGHVIPRLAEYKYLGVWVNEEQSYMEKHEKTTSAKGRRNAVIMKHRALWGYNRYEILRGIWKVVMVPGLTFGNAVLCLKSEVQVGLEISRRAVGRLALV